MDDETPREGRVVGRIPADTFAHRLTLARAETRLTIEEAAKRSGLLSQSWGQWERGSIPRDKVEVADAIADALDIDRDWLLHGGPLRKPERIGRNRLTYVHRSVRPGDHRTRPQRLDLRKRYSESSDQA
jgi:transcriptional regulator with XRE-family HTH domain